MNGKKTGYSPPKVVTLEGREIVGLLGPVSAGSGDYENGGHHKGEDQQRPLGECSGGMRNRVLLAKLLRERHGKRPLMVAADIKRPAAVEQLRSGA